MLLNNISEDVILYHHCCENLRPHKASIVCNGYSSAISFWNSEIWCKYSKIPSIPNTHNLKILVVWHFRKIVPGLNTFDLWLVVLQSVTFCHFILCYLEFIDPIELLKWLWEMSRWLNEYCWQVETCNVKDTLESGKSWIVVMAHTGLYYHLSLI
jgi:hypothetical protein